GEQSPRPERVHPPRTKSCNCEVGLFKQLREMVARGEVLDRSFVAGAAEEACSAAFVVEFADGQVQESGRDWDRLLNPAVRKLAGALMFSGKIAVLMVGGRIMGSDYTEVFVQAERRH
ncbi:MAG: hypothetical protein ACRD5F_03980, partial [Candidatus Acidiferrales bacterium]